MATIASITLVPGCTKAQKVDETVKLLHKPDFPHRTLTLLEKIAANLPGMIFQVLQRQDGSEQVMYVSSGCRELYELEPEVIQADLQVLHKLVHPQDANSLAESIEVAKATLSPWRWEGRIITPSGKIKWIQGASQLELQDNGDWLWEGLVIDITDRKQAEEQLRTSERRYKAILDAIPDLMFRLSRAGEYLDLKGDGANIVLPREEIVGKNLEDILPTDVVAISQDAIAKTLDSHNLQTCEYQLPTPLGIRDYEARLVASDTDEVLAIVRDITERKLAEANLQSLAQKYSKAFRCSPNPISLSTLEEGRYIEVNDSFVRLSGFERDEAIGRTSFELNMWVNNRDRMKLLQHLRDLGMVRNLEIEFRAKSGQILTSLLSAEIIELDGTPCILAVNHDITERKQVEAQLRLSAQRDRLLTETLARIRSSLNLEQILQTTVTEVRQFLQADRVFIGLNDAQQGGKTVAESVDPKYPAILGWTTEDKTYLQELKTLLSTNRVRLVEDIDQIAASPKLKEHYQQFQTRATLAVPIMVNNELLGALVANQCSGPRQWQAIEIDLLQQMSEQLAIAIQQARLYQELAILNTNLEHQVEERTAQLQQKMQELEGLQRVKDVVLHTVAHDLRTSVMGNLLVLKNLLKNRGQNQEASPAEIPVPRSVIERMIQGNDRQLGMIDSLLEIHSCEGQGMSLRRELVHFSTLLESIIKDLQPMLNQNQAILNNLLPDDLPLVMADPTQLQKVVANLFTHRLQNNPPGLRFTVKTKIEPGMIRTEIHDNGIVMSKLECDRLFDLSVREPQACCSTSLALKMYLSRQIIQAHGGEIGVSSSRKYGLTFWFSLPLATPSPVIRNS
ncbi:multi-sensor signal transduction histidine kinase [Tolypothrix tenuis PCC 7101]|uniref:histidine kinase n=1 Tax=Tolypothrix tenuis PCC 7101 TaxID=231146 RepID=A0A1Z4MVB4_9CYAN|nr:PAS domain S-box protein [Aulosira sp. FACHB-113]BAY97410.1 multi-sensor signal transduction histidine kinase [Tolypothrix tenuis PCC 7101]BAZ72081.1 multi-sensor signal transduction histidine kinase [Aulosira laxa NIES-50]